MKKARQSNLKTDRQFRKQAMSGSDIILRIAEKYIEKCKENVSKADVGVICSEYNFNELGYSSLQSMKAAVSKKLKSLKFNKKEFRLSLLKAAYESLQIIPESKESTIIKLQEKLENHQFKKALIRDYLQELSIGKKDSNLTSDALSAFREMIKKGHSYQGSIKSCKLSTHEQKKARQWFLEEHSGDKRETLKARRTKRDHYYLDLKEAFARKALSDLELDKIWTSIGFIFADGSCQESSIQIVITAEDGYYLENHVTPSLLDSSRPGNKGPELLTAHSIAHETAYSGSKPVLRAHLEDSQLASFLNELGMPRNKARESIRLSNTILDLPDRHFFCFIAGLFAGDGSITRQKPSHLHIDFDLHCRVFCEQISHEIERRLDIPMAVLSHKTKANKLHYKASATTNWRALSLLFTMLYYAPFHLSRKTHSAEIYFQQLKMHVGHYQKIKFSPNDFANKKISASDFSNCLETLMTFRKPHKNKIRAPILLPSAP